MAVPERFHTQVEAHVARWRQFEDDLIDLLGDLDLTDPRSRRRLNRLARDIDTEADRLAGDTRVLLAAELPAVWAAGAVSARVGRFSWDDPAHAAALAAFATDTVAEVAAVARAMSGDVRALTQALSGGDLDRVRGLARRLRAVGVTAITDTAGRARRASTQVGVILDARVTAAFNLAALNQMRGAGVELVAISDGDDCGLTGHDDPQLADGLVVTVDVAAVYPLSHPRCRRELTAWAGDGPTFTATDEDLALARGSFFRYLLATPPAEQSTVGRQPREARAARTTRAPRGPRSSRSAA